MSYNWIQDRNSAFNAIKQVTNELVEKYDFSLQHKGENQGIHFSQSIAGNKILLKITVTRSAPYELYFESQNKSIC